MQEYKAEMRHVRRMLTGRWERLQKAEEALSAQRMMADSLRGKAIDLAGDRQSKGGTTDPTASVAAKLCAARDRVMLCRAWVQLGNQIALMLEDSWSGIVFDLYFDDRMTVAAIARHEGCTIHKVYDTIDQIVAMACWKAAEAQLTQGRRRRK